MRTIDKILKAYGIANERHYRTHEIRLTDEDNKAVCREIAGERDPLIYALHEEYLSYCVNGRGEPKLFALPVRIVTDRSCVRAITRYDRRACESGFVKTAAGEPPAFLTKYDAVPVFADIYLEDVCDE